MERMIVLTVNRPLPSDLRRSPVSADSVVEAMGDEAVLSASEGDPIESLAEMQVETTDLNEREQAELKQDPRVAASSRLMPVKLIAPVRRDQDETNGPETGEGPTWGIEAIGADASNFSGIGVKVAVLDTGIDRSHQAFTDMRIVEGRNYRDFTGEGFEDSDGHGTHCAGTIFGRDVDGRRIGVAKGVRDVLIGKVLGEDGGDTEKLVRAIDWAIAERANVISMSLGYDVPGLATALVEERGLEMDAAFGFALTVFHQNLDVFNAMMAKIEAISSAGGAIPGLGSGTVIAAASGNESNAGENPAHRLPASLPSASRGVVSVGALRETAADRYAVGGFSNGDVRVAAPGVDVLSAQAGGGLTAWDGTSMATPHVAGILALIFEQEELRGAQGLAERVEARLIASADSSKIDAVSQSDYGAGLVKAP